MSNSWILPKEISTKDPYISLTFIGSGFGECIVINIGGKYIGIIDSCSSLVKEKNPEENIKILDSICKKNKNSIFGFILLTHPHLDHFSQMHHVLNKLQKKVKRVCFFQGNTELEIQKIFETPPNGIERNNTIYSYYKNYYRLVQVYSSLSPHQRLKVSDRTLIHKFTLLSPRGAIPVEIECLAPSDSDCQKFSEQINSNNFLGLTTSSDSRMRQEGNTVSVVVKIAFGDTTILLGGDATEQNWNQIFEKNENVDLECNVYKVCHHGSKHGNTENIINKITKANKSEYLGQDTIAIIAPFDRYHLPDEKVVELLHQNFNEVMKTNIGKKTKGDLDAFISAFPEIDKAQAIMKSSNCSYNVVFGPNGKKLNNQPE